MDPGERYEYENENADDYAQDEWYYQKQNSLEEEEDKDYFDQEEEPDWYFGEDD